MNLQSSMSNRPAAALVGAAALICVTSVLLLNGPLLGSTFFLSRWSDVLAQLWVGWLVIAAMSSLLAIRWRTMQLLTLSILLILIGVVAGKLFLTFVILGLDQSKQLSGPPFRPLPSIAFTVAWIVCQCIYTDKWRLILLADFCALLAAVTVASIDLRYP